MVLVFKVQKRVGFRHAFINKIASRVGFRHGNIFYQIALCFTGSSINAEGLAGNSL